MSDHRKLILWEVGMIAAVVATYLVSRILGALPAGASILALISTIVTTGAAVFVTMVQDWPETPTRKQYDPAYYDSYYDYVEIRESPDNGTPYITPKGDAIGCAIFSAIIVIGTGLGILAIGIGSGVGGSIVIGIAVLGITVALTTGSVTSRRFANIESSTHKTTGYITFFGILASLVLGGVLPETVPGIVGVIPGLIAIALLGLLALRKR